MYVTDLCLIHDLPKNDDVTRRRTTELVQIRCVCSTWWYCAVKYILLHTPSEEVQLSCCWTYPSIHPLSFVRCRAKLYRTTTATATAILVLLFLLIPTYIRPLHENKVKFITHALETRGSIFLARGRCGILGRILRRPTIKTSVEDSNQKTLPVSILSYHIKQASNHPTNQPTTQPQATIYKLIDSCTIPIDRRPWLDHGLSAPYPRDPIPIPNTNHCRPYPAVP